MKKGFARQERVADLIQKTLAQLLLREMNDETLRFVTITGVTVSNDLSYAKIYVSMLEEDETQIKEIIKTLNDEAKTLRYLLAKSVTLRMTPELKFYYDESTARGFKISNLINKAINKNEK